MKKIIYNLRIALIIFLFFCLFLLAGLVVQQYRGKTRLAVAAGENLASLQRRYAQAGTIYDRVGSVLAYSEDGIRKYSDNQDVAKALIHTVGDYTHRIDNTIETRYQQVLLGTSRNPFHQFWLDLRGKGLTGDSIVLTLDSQLSVQAAHLLGDSKGSIVILNYTTGEVIVSVSKPFVSPQSVIDYSDIPDSGLYNRALIGAYAPGSIFKLITAAAWLQSDLYDPNYQVVCGGDSTIHPDAAKENGDGHGPVDLQKAISESCNVFFGEIGVLLGTDQLQKTAESFGIGKNFNVDLLNGYPGVIACDNNEIELSWLAIGQPSGDSELAVSPMQIARITGAIAMRGELKHTHIVDHFIDPAGRKYNQLKASTEEIMLNSETASKLTAMMIRAVEEGSAAAACLPDTVIAGKTGTVEVAGQANNALFTGFIADENTPFAITVVIEQGGSGGQTAAPIAAELFEAVINKYKD